MATYLIRKLERYSRLSGQDKEALVQAASGTARLVRPRQDVLHEGDRPSQISLILNGWACRYKMLEDGRRQIMNFLLPGDICDLRMFILKQMDHSVCAISPVRIAEIPAHVFLQITDTCPRVSRALWWASLVEEAITREWLVNNSQRNAAERMAHLLCELFIRLRSVGLTDGQSCEIPVTQAELADTTGLSTVHVNRTLQDLRAAGLIVFKSKTLTIPDLRALQDAALFNANYLHLDHEGQDMDANEDLPAK